MEDYSNSTFEYPYRRRFYRPYYSPYYNPYYYRHPFPALRDVIRSRSDIKQALEFWRLLKAQYPDLKKETLLKKLRKLMLKAQKNPLQVVTPNDKEVVGHHLGKLDNDKHYRSSAYRYPGSYNALRKNANYFREGILPMRRWGRYGEMSGSIEDLINFFDARDPSSNFLNPTTSTTSQSRSPSTAAAITTTTSTTPPAVAVTTTDIQTETPKAKLTNRNTQANDIQAMANEATIQRNKKQLKKNTETIRKLRKIKDIAKNKIDDMNTEYDKIIEKSGKRKGRIVEQQKRIHDLETEKSALERTVDRLNSEITQKEREQETLRSQAEAAQEASNAEINNLRTTVTLKKQKNQKLKNTISELERDFNENKERNETEIRNLTNNLATTEEKLKEIQELYQEELAKNFNTSEAEREHQKRIHDLEVQKARLSTDIAALKGNITLKENEKQDIIDQFNQERQNLTNHIQTLNQNIQVLGATNNNMRQELIGQLNTTKAIRDQLAAERGVAINQINQLAANLNQQAYALYREKKQHEHENANEKFHITAAYANLMNAYEKAAQEIRIQYRQKAAELSQRYKEINPDSSLKVNDLPSIPSPLYSEDEISNLSLTHDPTTNSANIQTAAITRPKAAVEREKSPSPSPDIPELSAASFKKVPPTEEIRTPADLPVQSPTGQAPSLHLSPLSNNNEVAEESGETIDGDAQEDATEQSNDEDDYEEVDVDDSDDETVHPSTLPYASESQQWDPNVLLDKNGNYIPSSHVSKNSPNNSSFQSTPSVFQLKDLGVSDNAQNQLINDEYFMTQHNVVPMKNDKGVKYDYVKKQPYKEMVADAREDLTTPTSQLTDKMTSDKEELVADKRIQEQIERGEMEDENAQNDNDDENIEDEEESEDEEEDNEFIVADSDISDQVRKELKEAKQKRKEQKEAEKNRNNQTTSPEQITISNSPGANITISPSGSSQLSQPQSQQQSHQSRQTPSTPIREIQESMKQLTDKVTEALTPSYNPNALPHSAIRQAKTSDILSPTTRTPATPRLGTAAASRMRKKQIISTLQQTIRNQGIYNPNDLIMHNMWPSDRTIKSNLFHQKNTRELYHTLRELYFDTNIIKDDDGSILRQIKNLVGGKK